MPPVPPGYRRIDGSERKIARDARLVGPADPDETFSVTIYVRRNPQAPPLLDMAHWMKTPPGKRKFLSREEFAAQYGAAQPDVDKVTKFAKSHGLKVLETSLPKRSVSVSGTVKQMNGAFGVALGNYERGKETYRGREGYVNIPEELGDAVKGVFGLDNRPVGRRPHNVPGTQVMTPPWVAKLYNFPATGAKNQTIGLLEFGGGFQQNDILDYFGAPGAPHGTASSPLQNNTNGPTFPNLTAPTPVVVPVTNGTVVGKNNPGVVEKDDAEVMLDICVASSVAQNPNTGASAANIALYFAPQSGGGGAYSTASDIAATILAAVNDAQNKPSVISNSWGFGAEDLDWTAAHKDVVDEALQAAAMMGVTVLMASGDGGSDDSANDTHAHVDFPASDPWVTCCGGTIISNASGSSPQENTWNEVIAGDGGGATGGGVSSYFGLPDYQANVNVPTNANLPSAGGGGTGRGVPDVSGNASIYAGYAIVLWQQNPFPLATDANGTPYANGGTSVVVPLYAALVAILNASLGAPIGFLNPTLYSLSGTFVFNYIGDGANNENPNPGEKTAPYYTSVPGQVWNACCGLGSINGTNLLNAIVSSNTIVTKNFYFVVNKNSFGLDEVIDTPTWPNAFWLVLEGFAPNQVNLTALNPVLSGAFFAAVQAISMNASGPVLELPNYTSTPQRILIPYDITFPAVSLATPAPFPAAGGVSDILNASITVQGQSQPLGASAVFELVAGEDPYFANIGPQNNVWWLSQDLRVFTVTPGYNASPIDGTGTPPTFEFTTGNSTTLDAEAAFNFIQALIQYLNQNYSTPSLPGSPDPLDSVLPSQAGALTGDSSVTPTSPNSNDANAPFYNYNFAIARVRLNAAPSAGGTTAQSVRVFFRLLLTMSDGTDYQPNTTYLSATDTAGYPGSPQADPNNDTVPFFATGYYDSNGPTPEADYGAAPGYQANPPASANNQNISIPAAGGSIWQYFGCFLDVYDPSYSVNHTPIQNILVGTHHCLVAQIAYDGAPILSTASVTATPASSDKLAQRNLQITTSGNPGPPPTHRVPQTFDTRPSRPTASLVGELLNYPDELMIQWGNTPQNSTASIYWPGVDSKEVLKLADKLYTTHQLSASDSHTIQCKTTSGATYVPIPPGAGQSFAGLFTVDLPSGITSGQEFNIVVHRIGTRRTPVDQPRQVAGAQSKLVSDPTTLRNWRCNLGSFQVRIPVSADEALLGPEEQTLSIMKWRLQSMLPTNRRYPVLQRYVSYLSARVSGMGGNPSQVLPWQPGTPAGGGAYPHLPHEYTGKVSGLIYDRFGDFRGFLLRTEGGDEIKFRSRESEIEGLVRDSWVDRTLISVFASERGERWVERIILRRTPKRIKP